MNKKFRVMQRRQRKRGTQLRMGISQCSILGEGFMAAIFSFIPNNYTYFHGTFCLYQFFIRVIKEISTKQGACPRIHEI